MYQKVFESKILLIYGISGTGKTSLINCGLANMFEESDWLPINVRRGLNITDSLLEELKRVAITTYGGREGGKERINKLIQSIYLDHFKPIYLIFDQFEELFIFGNREERGEFIEIVKAIVDSDVPCRFVFSIREEYLAAVSEFEDIIPDFMTNRMRIEKMTQKHAIEAIEGPCKVQRIDMEEGFAQALLDKLNPEGNEVELTYLQVFLDKVYKLAIEKPETKNQQSVTKNKEKATTSQDYSTQPNPGLRMSMSLLGKVGDVSDLLGSFLEEQISQLEDPDMGLTVLKAFVSIKGTKRQITEEEIIDFSKTFGKPIENELLRKLVQRFVNLRILRDKDENGRYELRHDSLAMAIYEKITLVEKELIEVRQFIENAYENYKRRGILLAQEDLDYLNVYKLKLFVGKDLEDFIQKSNSSVQVKMRTLKRVTSFSILALLIVIFLMGYYYYIKKDKSRAVDFSVQALLQKDISPQISFQSAYQAYLINPNNTITKKAIFDAFYSLFESEPHMELFNFEPGGSEIINASFSEDDKFITGFLKDSSACVWNRRGEKIISLDFSHPVLSVKLSGDNHYLGVLCSDSNVYIYDLDGVKVLNVKVRYHVLHPDDVFQFSTDGTFMLHISPSNEIIITELPSGITRQIISGSESDVNDIAFSPDQNWLAAGLANGTIKIWNKMDAKDFTFFRMIEAHNGSVWSVDFQDNSKFILSASADSNYCIWDLNGEKVYGSFDWAYPEQNKDPYCKALFRGKDRGIVLTAYNNLGEDTENNSEKSTIYGDSYKYYTRLDFSEYSPVSFSDRSIYIGRSESDLDERLKSNQPGSGLIQIDYSPNGFYYALTNPDNRTTGIYYADGLNLRILKGNKPVFSNDGKYLICIENEMIRLYPAEVNELIRLVLEEKIFGPINPKSTDKRE
jgi:WD40 repeat protein